MMHSLRLQDFFSRQIDAFGICNTKGSPVFTGLPADPLETFQLLFLSHIPINEKQIENDQKKTEAGKGHDHIRA